MLALLIYSLKLSICLGVIYLFYYLALRNLTYYNWNRWYLLIGTGLSFLIPLVNVLPFLKSQEAQNLKIIKAIPTFDNLSGQVLYINKASESYDEYLFYFSFILFALGVLIQAGKLIIQFVSFFRIRRSAKRLEGEIIKIYQVDKNMAPFSFGNSIFLNKNLLQPAELQEVIKHELVHIRQKHTIDVMWLECLCLINWFNPFVWLLKGAVRQNLEFIADRAVLMAPHLDKKYYQYLMLKIIGLPDFTIANQFNISSLKTRIMMMNRMPSSKRELAKFVFVLPMMALLLLACQEDVSLSEVTKESTGLMQNVPPPPIPEPAISSLNSPPPPMVNSINFKPFFERNPNVKNLEPEFLNNKISSILLELKSGKQERYNLKNESELSQFQQRYGNLPIQNLPPPPPPIVIKASEEVKSLIRLNSQIDGLGWQGEYTMVIFLKSGQREEYDLNNPVDRAMAKKKYGELPPKPLLTPSASPSK